MFRRAFLFLALACLTAFAAPGAAQAERLYVQDTNDGYLNLRSGPGTNYGIIQRIYGGMELDGVGASGNWRRIILPDGTNGWASATYLTHRYGQGRYYDAFVTRTSDGYLNLRHGPGTNYGIIQRLYAGQGLQILDFSGSWRRVALADGTVGWASGNYMR